MITYHIRAPKPHLGHHNQFYPLGSSRADKTLCGVPVTDHDNKFSWQVYLEPVGNFEICPECVRLKDEVKRLRERK